MAVTTPMGAFGHRAPSFSLRGVDGRFWTLDDVRGPRGTVVIFMCNHCPYVRAILDRIIRDAAELASLGVGCVAINSNDPVQYPEDDYPAMQHLAQTQNFPFPYLFDEDQTVARAYDAVCTPDFFGFDADLRLRYRGRLDASRKEPAAPDTPRELFRAMLQIAASGEGPEQQYPSLGCSIKWRISPEE